MKSEYEFTEDEILKISKEDPDACRHFLPEPNDWEEIQNDLS